MIVRTVLAILLALAAADPAVVKEIELKGKPITAPIDLTSDEKGEGDQIAAGGITFWVHMSGDRRTIRIRDVNGEPARAFENFNQAYNPPCSFNPYTTCPLPLKENRLTARILAGEKAYPHPPHSNQ